ncbi:MAG: hypothetical protein M1333_02710 [Patescibacteria group bacterium]|nr:hypothetical protein [Patescibacteria group bacterium]
MKKFLSSGIFIAVVLLVGVGVFTFADKAQASDGTFTSWVSYTYSPPTGGWIDLNSPNLTVPYGTVVLLKWNNRWNLSSGCFPGASEPRCIPPEYPSSANTVVTWRQASCPAGVTCYWYSRSGNYWLDWGIVANATYTNTISMTFPGPGTYTIDFTTNEYPTACIQSGGTCIPPTSGRATITLTPPPKPAISLSPGSFSFSNVEGQSGPAAQNLTVRNSGAATMNWTASTNQAWCHVSPASGSLGAGAQAVTTISVDTQTPGSYGCTVTVSDANATNNPQTAAVTYIVIPKTVVNLSASPTSVAYNTASTLSWITSGNPTSCTASGSWSGAKAASGSQSTGNLTSNQNYTLSCSGPGGTDTKSVAVSVGAQPSATIGVNPAIMPAFSAVSGQAAPAPKTLTITNTAAAGAKNLNWTASTNQTWCHVSPASGTLVPGSSAATSVSVDVPSNVGTFNCSVTVTDPAATNPSQASAATYTVIAATAVTISVSPPFIAYNGSATINWSVAGNPTSCTASGSWSGAKAASGSQSTGNLTSNQNYTLSCTGPGGTDTKSAGVTVGAQPPAVSLSVDQSNINYNASANLFWSVTGGAGISCTATGAWSGSKPLSGSQNTGNLVVSQSYTLTCTNSGGSNSKTVTVNVGPQPTALTFSAVQTTLAYNSSTNLNWSTTGAAPVSCTASGAWSGAKAASGSESTGNLTASKTYALSCTGPGGTDTKSVTINVGPQPMPGISLNPGSLTFSAISQGTNPGPKTTILQNTGNTTLNWVTAATAGKPGTWCDVSPVSGTLVAGGTAIITATVNNPSNVGSFSDCGVTFSDQTFPAINNALGFIYNVTPGACPTASVQSVPASMTVGQTATASAPAGFTGGTFQSSNPVSATVNSASGLITAVAQGSATITGSNWNYTPNGATGCTLNGTGASISISPAPVYAYTVSPGAVTFSDTLQGAALPAGQAITVSNTGNQAMTIAISKNMAWADINKASVSLNPGQSDTVVVTANTSSLSPNTYNGVVSFSQAQAGGKTSNVNYTVLISTVSDPTNINGVNTGVGLACGQIKVTWTDNSVGEQGFKVYRSTIDNPGTAALAATVPSTSSNITGTGYSYVDTSPPLQYNTPYYFWVTAYTSTGIESARANGATGAINNTSCEANLDTSDKDITSVNGVTNGTNACQTNGEFPANVQFKAGDVIGFAINLCNTAPASGGKEASQIVIDDTLYNLAHANSAVADLTNPAAWNATVTGGLAISSITTSGTEPDNLRLRITLSGTMAGGSSGKLMLYAKVAFPVNFSGSSSRFQNSASISYNNGVVPVSVPVLKTTPLLLFTSGPTPTKTEMPPQ